MPGRDGPSQFHSPSAPRFVPDWVAVETDELRVAGSRLLGCSDEVAATRRQGLLVRHGAWSPRPVQTAATRFADRFDYMLRQLVAELDQAGNTVRGQADGYDEVDAAAATLLDLGP